MCKVRISSCNFIEDWTIVLEKIAISHQPGPDFIFRKHTFGGKECRSGFFPTLGIQRGLSFTTMRLRTQSSPILA